MFIERLSFSSDSPYNPLELSIHLARYALAQQFCQGLDVLDIACGEGYGAYIMANRWGAKSVKAVDVSSEAIQVAQTNFACPNVDYLCGNAEEIDSIFEPASFDTIISLETIEHVNSPDKFLKAIRTVLKPNGIAIISCPNDHWYYGADKKSGNPYHLHTFYFEEFQQLAEQYLGEASCYLLGLPLYGFGNFSQTNTVRDEEWMLSGLTNMQSARCNSISKQDDISVNNCSYFVGIWGASSAIETSCTVYPTSMDTFRVPNTTLRETLSHNQWLEERIASFEKWSADLQQELEKARSQLQVEGQKSEDLWAELCHYKEELERSQAQLKIEGEKTENLWEEMLSYKHKAEDMQSQLHAEQQKAASLSEELCQSKQEIAQSQQNLERSQQQITAIESSKFWQLRQQWLKIERIFKRSA